MKNKFMALMLAGVMVMTAVGCGSAAKQPAENTENAATEAAAETAEEETAEAEATAEAAEEAATDAADETEAAAAEATTETAAETATDAAGLGYKTLGDAFVNDEYAHSFTDTKFVYAFEKDGSVYRVAADITPELSEKLFALDFGLEDYDEQMKALAADCEITETENLTANTPDQAEIDKNIGRTGAELLEEGWYVSAAYAEGNEYTMGYGPYEYNITFEGDADKNFAFDEDGYFAPMKVASITFNGIGDAAYSGM